MTVGRGIDFERKETQSILKVLKNTNFDLDHNRGKYKQTNWRSEREVKLAFGEDLFWYIKQMTYPYGDPINGCWSHFYRAGLKDRDIPPPSGKGHGYYLFQPSMGLHQDRWRCLNRYGVKNPHKFWSTTLLVTKSDDLEGGKIVLAGDSMDDDKILGSRLKIVDLKEKGQTASWNGNTVHGVTEITKGFRWIFVTYKVEK